MLDEIDDLKEEVDNLQTELQATRDERDRQIDDMRGQLEKIKAQTEAEWKKKLKEADREARERAAVMNLELDMMRQAFSGDTGGWTKVETPTQEYYQNTETGEVREDEPEVLFVARSMKKCQEAEELIVETQQLRQTKIENEAKIKELTLQVNKTKTELNSLKQMDKSWKEATKVIHATMMGSKAMLDAQMDQILLGLSAVSKTGKRVHSTVPLVDLCREQYEQLKSRVLKQEDEIIKANAQIRGLTSELAEKTARVDRLSAGLDEEVERLAKPMRDKMAESMVLVMKEKAARAQERREIADIWPDNLMLPTVLMQYRTLDAGERARRVAKFHQLNANAALVLEIKANVAESKKWTQEFDDYGRPFYQHTETKQTSEEKPAIIDYVPPPGRDESGNIQQNAQELGLWKMMTNHKGMVYFQHGKTGEISYVAPYAYPKVPLGRSEVELAGEAAKIVLIFIKQKIAKHIAKMAKVKKRLENPVSAEEKATYLAENGIPYPEDDDKDEDDQTNEDLSLYVYDIETVEMLAAKFEGPAKGDDKDNLDDEEKRAQKLSFMADSEVRKFDQHEHDKNSIGPTLLETDVTEMGIPEVRKIVESLAALEEKHEARLNRTRNNLRDFSYLLMDKITALDKAREDALRAEQEEKLAARKEQMRIERIAAKKEARRKKREAEAEAAVAFANMQKMLHGEESLTAGEEALPSSEQKDGDGVLPSDGSGEKQGIDTDDKSVHSTAKSIGDKSVGDKSTGDKSVKSKDSKAAAAADAKADDKSIKSKEGGSVEGKSVPKDDDDGTLLDDDEEEESTVRKHEDGDDARSDTSDITGIDDLELEEPGDPDVLLYGEVSLDFSNPQFNEEIMRSSLNLVNFAVFCGYANLHIDEAPDDANHELSMLPEEGEEAAQEDQWLTHSFFLGINKEKIDAVREVTSLQYDPMLGLLNTIPLATARLVQEASPSHNSRGDKPYTAAVENVSENLRATHALWKSQQLMMEVLRFQFQQAAVREAFYNRFQDIADEKIDRRNSRVSLIPMTAALNARQRPVEVWIKRVVATNISTKVWADQQPQFIHMSIGPWGTRTTTLVATGRPLVWENLDIRAVMPLDRLQLDDMLVEAFDEHSLRQNVRLAYAHQPVNKVLGVKLATDVELEFALIDERKSSTGATVKILLTCDYLKEDPPFNSDPDELLQKEVNIVQSPVPDVYIPMVDGVGGASQQMIQSSAHPFEAAGPGLIVRQSSNRSVISNLSAGGAEDNQIQPTQDYARTDGRRPSVGLVSLAEQSVGTAQSASTKVEDDALSGLYPQSLDKQHESFEQIVADLRGDGCNFMKRLVGDVITADVLKAGHRVNEMAVKQLPNFKKAAAYLEKKAQIHNREAELLRLKVTESNAKLDVILEEKLTSVTEQYTAAKKEYDRMLDVSADIKNKVKYIVANLDDLRKPAQRPIEPSFPVLPDLPYVPRIPEKGALDEKGKKKKQVPNAEFKKIVDDVTDGKLDAVEWDFGKFWPTQAQIIKITKALTDRNEVMDAKRLEENASRMKIIERYNGELDRWETEEKARKVEFDKTKKESRKANLRLDCYMERADRRNVMTMNLARDAQTLKDLMDLHKKSKDRTKVMGMKQYFEAERQKEVMVKLRKRLLKALDARKRALDLPRGAINKVQFEELRGKAEEALRTLRVEVVECKQLLLAEGIRLRVMRNDEITMLKSEHVRAGMTLETLMQKDDIDKVVNKYQYEVVHLMEAMEKLLIIEADKDDRGLKDTVDNAGERYAPSKKWESKEILQCQALIELCMEKINLTEGYAGTSSRSMKLVAEALTTKWGTDFTPVRDSWCENSDYDRSQKLVHDVVQWVTIQRNKLGDAEKSAESEATELRLQIHAADEQAELMLKNQESDTKYVTESALNIVNVMQGHIAGMRETAKKREDELEAQITDIVRECQQVREQLMYQAQANDSKQKLLWAMISTLQTATQSLATRMEIVTDERDRTVYACKMDNDKMKHQLRLERKHGANLLFIIHSQRGTLKYLKDVIAHHEAQVKRISQGAARERAIFRKEIWEQIFTFTRLSTDVDALFEFFAARLANLSGARKSINEQLANNGAAMVLSALCKSSRPVIRKYAARALGGLGWDGYVETRILLWDCVMHWKLFKATTLEKEEHAYKKGFKTFTETGKFDALLNIEGSVEEFVPSGNMSLRTIIKQRRQWALRATRRIEGPNNTNQRLINMKDGIIPSLLQLCVRDGDVDWEIARNAALAISIASFEPQNHYDMTNDQACIQMLIRMCCKDDADAEVQTHAAVTIANLCHKDENAQFIFGNSEAIPAIIGMCSSIIVDVLEAATSALANLTCFCDSNCNRVMQGGGVAEMVRLVTQSYSENLLDLDQNDEIQANAAEMLANVSRVNGEFTTKFFDATVINAIILMCAATNKQVKRHAPLVLGNIAQSEECREIVGERGGIEALFLVLEDEDLTIKANTLWALCNLMWFPPNQERAGRFLSEIIRYLSDEYLPIKTHSSILLANVLYYNNPNRVRFLESEGAMELVISFIQQRVENSIVEASLRAVLALSYLDNIALWLGTDGACIPTFLSLMVPAFITRDCMRYSLEICTNLCVHHSNRLALIDNGGIEVIVSLQNDPDPHIQDLSHQLIKYLEDVTPAEVLAKAKMDIGLERMIVLATNTDPIVRAVAAESIGEEVWHNPKMQKRALEVGGVDVLLNMANNPDETVASLLPALWSLRNMLHENGAAQTQLAHRDGMVVLTTVIGRCSVGQYTDQTEKILEAVLACMASAISSHERNARRLLVVGLEALMDLADGNVDVGGADNVTRGGLGGEGVLALAKSILLMLGPYNYVVCRNCNKKQDLNGTNCYSCGHRLRVDPMDKSERNIMNQSMNSANTKKALPLASATAPAALAGGIMPSKKGTLKKVTFPAPGSSNPGQTK